MPPGAAALIAAWVLAAPPAADHGVSVAQAVVPHCQVALLDDVDVPAQEAGAMTAVNVKPGDLVQPDQVLAQVDDRQAVLQKESAELERAAAVARAEDDIEVRFAAKSFELAQAELQQDVEINRKSPGAVPESELRRKQLALHRAQLQIDRSRLDQKVAGMTADVQAAAVRAAEESILRRRIVAPFAGMVVDVFRETAEWVNAGDPVLRIVRLDRLRVDGFLDATQLNATDVANRPVTIQIELARGRVEQFTGEVVFVSPIVQAGQKYRVSAEVQNREEQGQPLLRPGMTATMTIRL